MQHTPPTQNQSHRPPNCERLLNKPPTASQRPAGSWTVGSPSHAALLICDARQALGEGMGRSRHTDASRAEVQSTSLPTGHDRDTHRRPYLLSYCYYWRPQGDSNPCCRRERGVRDQFRADSGQRWTVYMIDITKFCIHSIPPLSGHIRSVYFPYGPCPPGRRFLAGYGKRTKRESLPWPALFATRKSIPARPEAGCAA